MTYKFRILNNFSSENHYFHRHETWHLYHTLVDGIDLWTSAFHIEWYHYDQSKAKLYDNLIKQTVAWKWTASIISKSVIVLQSWALLAVNIGWQGGIHCQTCGHYVHLDCLKSYIETLRQESLPPYSSVLKGVVNFFLFHER